VNEGDDVQYVLYQVLAIRTLLFVSCSVIPFSFLSSLPARREVVWCGIFMLRKKRARRNLAVESLETDLYFQEVSLLGRGYGER
jgi:hypothetical protein